MGDSAAIAAAVVSGAVSLASMAGGLATIRITHRYAERADARQQFDEHRAELYIQIGSAVAEAWTQLTDIVRLTGVGEPVPQEYNAGYLLTPRVRVYAPEPVWTAYCAWRTAVFAAFDEAVAGKGVIGTAKPGSWLVLPPQDETLRRTGNALLDAIREDVEEGIAGRRWRRRGWPRRRRHVDSV